MRDESGGNGTSTILAFLLGAALGGAAALLLAPRSGKETREYLADRGRAIGGKARDVRDSTRSYFQGKKEDIGEAIAAGRQAMRHEQPRTKSEA
jgi:gas vesicle protein